MDSVTITTGGGYEYQAMYAGIGLDGRFKTQIYDQRPISRLAAELEGETMITVTDAAGEGTAYDGYSELHRIERVDARMVMVRMQRPTDNPE